MAAQFKRKHAISLSESSHNTVSSSKIPHHQSTSSAGNSLNSNTSQLKLHEFSSTKSTFSSNSQKIFSNQIFRFQVTCIKLAFLFIKIISSLLINRSISSVVSPTFYLPSVFFNLMMFLFLKCVLSKKIES